MKKTFYNVWWKRGGHWTVNMIDHCGTNDTRYMQSRTYPIPLTKAEAQELLRQSLICSPWAIGEYEIRPIDGAMKPPKVIPGFPLDPTLHILQAGYIQDRQRKRS